MLVLILILAIIMLIVFPNSDKQIIERVEYKESVIMLGINQKQEAPQVEVQAPILVETVIDDPVEEENKGLHIRYNYSFIARLHQAPLESQERFSDLKNYLLSYEDVKVSHSWRYERFMYQGKPIVKIWIHGNTMKLYFNLDPTQFDDTKYNVENVSSARMHETTPTLLLVSGPRLLDYAKELVDLYMKDTGSNKNEEPNVDYTLPYQDKKTLINRQLIKIKELKS